MNQTNVDELIEWSLEIRKHDHKLELKYYENEWSLEENAPG